MGKNKKEKSSEPYERVLDHAKEAAAVEQYWPMTNESKLRKPPKDYKYVDETRPPAVRADQAAGVGAATTASRSWCMFEGRDAAGKGGVDQAHHRAAQPAHLPRRGARHADRDASAGSGTSSATSRICRPRARSSCSTAAGTTAPASSASWASAPTRSTAEFLRACPLFEEMLVRSGIILVKYWFSVNDEEQERALPGAHAQSDQALEAQPDGPRIAQALGRLLAGPRT